MCFAFIVLCFINFNISTNLQIAQLSISKCGSNSCCNCYVVIAAVVLVAIPAVIFVVVGAAAAAAGKTRARTKTLLDK